MRKAPERLSKVPCRECVRAVWANQEGGGAGGYVTGDRTSTITATSNISFSQGTASNLVDGVDGSDTSSDAVQLPAVTSSGKYFRFDFGTATTFVEARHTSANTDTHGVFKWQGSNVAGGASGYVDIGSSFTWGGVAQTHTELNGNSTAYRYYQLIGLSSSFSGNCWIREWEFKTDASPSIMETQLHGWAVNY